MPRRASRKRTAHKSRRRRSRTVHRIRIDQCGVFKRSSSSTRSTRRCTKKPGHTDRHGDERGDWGKPLRILRGGYYYYLTYSGRYRRPYAGEPGLRRPRKKRARR